MAFFSTRGYVKRHFAIARTQEYGFITRNYANDLTFWLPEMLGLKYIITRFEGIAINAIAPHPVRLEYI
ncbi:MAG: hypothetical protein V7K47_23780 [Nostoc sp.]